MNRFFFKILVTISLPFLLNGLNLIQEQEKVEASISSISKKKEYYLSICAIFRDEARFLKEWIEFHRLLGVEHFYLVNNLSTDDYQSVLEPYIKENIVELYQWNYETTDPVKWRPIQVAAYQMIIEKSAKKTEWLAILDTDEFLFPVEGDSLKNFLDKYEQYPAVCVNWQLFGTSGVDHVQSNELMIDRLTLKAPKEYYENIHVKSILKPSYVKKCFNPHSCYFKGDRYQVTENMIEFEGPFSPDISVDKIRINHYWSRDEDFLYNVKIARRKKWGEEGDDCLRRNQDINIEPDFEILRFSKALAERMLD